MNGCERFLAELDTLGPERVSAAHPDACAPCARALAAARAVDDLLAPVTAIAAPADFTARVLARVRADAPARVPAAPVTLFEDPLPLWARLAAEPRVAGALVAAALLVSQAGKLITLGRAALLELGGRAAAAGASWTTAPLGVELNARFTSEAAQLALLGSAMSLLAIAAVPLYRWSERLVNPRGR
jgi:hypothetical protein